MFRFLHRKNKKVIQNQEDVTDLNFRDATLQNINITIFPVGNSTVLKLQEPNNNFEITLDNEMCLVLGTILNEYGITGKFNKVASLLTKGEDFNG